MLLGIVVIVLLGAGGAGFWFWRQSSTAVEAHAPAPEHEEGGGVLALEPFLVNLADAEASRFLRVTVRLVVGTEEQAKEFEENKVHAARVRSALLELLATQRASVLVTPEGKDALKHAISERAGQVLKLEIHDVLFTDFLVQF